MRSLSLPFGLSLLLLLDARPARAHGLWGHLHVTGWAAENMPDDELRAFLLEPEVFNALLFGAVFTDTGYARNDPASRAYSEHAHWEPFVEDYIDWMRQNDPPPWDDLESRKRAAFILGVASHGLQDSLFDSLFLYQVAEHDGAGQDEADPGTDGFLVQDGYARFVPETWLPMDVLLALYADVDPAITEELITRSVGTVTGFYINDQGGLQTAALLGDNYADALPWTRQHYMDPEIPGSLLSEVFPTMRYQQAVWARLHGDRDTTDLVAYAFPEPPRRLRRGSAGVADSWATLVLGRGVAYEDGLVELLGPDGSPVAATQGNSRWGPSHTRLLRIMPDEDLAPGGWYTARLRAGVSTIDGLSSSAAWELRFQVECDAETAVDCDELGEIAVARTDGLPVEDGDSGAGETAPDLGTPAAGPPDEGCGCSQGSAPARSGTTLLGLLTGLVAMGRRHGAKRAASGALEAR